MPRAFPLSILVLSLVAAPAFAQSSPTPEGNLPQTVEIARVIEVPKKVDVVPPAAAVVIPGDRSKGSRVLAGAAPRGSGARAIAGAAVPDASASAPPAMSAKSVVLRDPAFSGPVAIPVPGPGGASRVVEQDGKFIIVGASDMSVGEVNEQGLFLARFEADGTPDKTFGQGGTTRIALFAKNNMGNVSPPSVALSPSGKIVVARSIDDMFPGDVPGNLVSVARLDHEGNLDPTFGDGGLVFTTIKNHFEAHAVAVQRDEKVVVAGESGHSGDCREESCTQLATLVRYDANGRPDPTFGSSGVVRALLSAGGFPFSLAREASFSSLALQDNGLIVAAGEIASGTNDATSRTKMLVAEYFPTGQPNPAFNGSGSVTLTFDGPYQKFGARSVAIRENGRIIVGGNARLYEEGGSPECPIGWLVDEAFAFAQLTAGGELDAAFGNGGKVVVDINPRVGSSPARPLDGLTKVMIDPSGDVYAAGMSEGPVGNSERAVTFVALNANGSLKSNFGNAGTFSFGTYTPWRMWLAMDALLTSSGRLVISGSHWTNKLPDGYVLWAYSVAAKK